MWEAADSDYRAIDATGPSSGVYFYRLQAGDFVETKRMVVVRWDSHAHLDLCWADVHTRGCVD